MSAGRFRVRVGIATDLDEVLALERAAAEAPHWPAAEYAAILQNLPHHKEQAHETRRCLFVAQMEDRLVGFAVGKAVGAGAECMAELESVAVQASARRGGVGRALCDAVADWSRAQGAAALELEVRAASAGAIALYAGMGFVVQGRRRNYYREPLDDALLMRLSLNAAALCGPGEPGAAL